MTPYELVWAAGLYEGEGCLYLAKGRPQARLAMTDEDVVQRFAKVIGAGNVTKQKPGPGSRKPQYLWCLGHQPSLSKIMWSLYPVLGQRRRAKIDELLGEWVKTKAATHRQQKAPQWR